MTGKVAESVKGRMLFFLPWEFDMIGGVDVVVDRLWREVERTMPGRSLIGIQDWSFEGEKVDAGGRKFLHVNFPAPSGPQPLSPRYLLTAVRRLPTMLRQLRAYDIQVVNFHFPRLNVYPLALLKRAGLWQGRIVLSFHGSDVKEIDLANPAWRVIASQTDAITACSAALAERIKALGLFGQTPVRVVHNGIDCAHFQAESGDSGVPAGTPFILNIGNYVPRKAQNVLIEAFARIAGRFPELKLVLAGGADDGAWQPGLRKLAAERGVAERVIFLESIPQRQVADLMRQAICMAHSALDEPFGLVVIEAGACRLPVVASRVGGIPEIVNSPEYGWLYEVGNPAALAEALEAVLDDREEASRRAGNLLRRVQDTFSVEATAARFLDACLAR